MTNCINSWKNHKGSVYLTTKMTKQRRALVMSGGGAKGAFELGAIDYLVNDLKLDFDVISGVSTGSLNAAMLAQGRGYEGLKAQLRDLKREWFNLKKSDIIILSF